MLKTGFWILQRHRDASIPGNSHPKVRHLPCEPPPANQEGQSRIDDPRGPRRRTQGHAAPFEDYRCSECIDDIENLIDWVRCTAYGV